MNSVIRKRLTFLGVIFLAGVAHADVESRLRDAGPPIAIRLAGTEDAANESRVYIVQLRTPSAAEFHASTTYSVIGKPTIGRQSRAATFDKNSRDQIYSIFCPG